MTQSRLSVFDPVLWLCDVQSTIRAEDPPPPPEPEPPKPDATPPEVPPNEADKPAPAAEATPPASEDWRDKRLATLTARLRAAEAKLAESGDKPEPVAGESEAEFNKRVLTAANAISANNEFTRNCNEVAKQGKALFEDFQTRVDNLRKLADPNDAASVNAYNQFLIAAMETGEAPKLIHTLAGDLNEASRIMALPPLKMAVELTKLAGVVQDPSRAPQPIKPVGGRGASHEEIQPDDPERGAKLDKKTWFERRTKQVEERNTVH